MAEGDEEIRPEDQEVEGGAVKSFLEHLEDLRWVLIKCSVALVVSMLFCFSGTRQLKAILQWPIDRAYQRHIFLIPEDTNQTVTIQIAGLELKSFEVKSNRLGSIALGTNQYVSLQMDQVVVGTNTLMALRV